MDYIELALALARRAVGTTSPNPPVGAVLVRDGRIVGQGFTQPPGGPHAEAVALAQAGEAARGSTLYVTLEPCCYQGRTPPCTRAIVQAGVAEVRLATLDPNPKVNGAGRRELEAAGIQVAVGEREEEARELIEPHAKFSRTGLPFVIAKFAMSLDGKLATRKGRSRWLTGPEARAFVQSLRESVDAILVGVNTVLADDPQLTVRGKERQPLRVVVDSHGHTPPTARLLREPGRTVIAATATLDPASAWALGHAGAEIWELPSSHGLVDVAALLKALGERQLTSVLVEGGGTLLGSFFDQRLVDKVLAFIAPVIIGGREAVTPVAGEGVEELSQALRLHRVSVQSFGPDLLVEGYMTEEA